MTSELLIALHAATGWGRPPVSTRTSSLGRSTTLHGSGRWQIVASTSWVSPDEPPSNVAGRRCCRCLQCTRIRVVERSAGAVSDAPSSPVSWQSAGDSYSSGEGVFGNVGDCVQSDRAYGRLTADALRSRGWDISSETFTACTGHLVEDYFDERPNADGKASLWSGRQQGGPDRVDVITMSFGGNDIGFADQIVDCLPVPDSWVGYIPIPPTLLSNFTGCDTSQREMEVGSMRCLIHPSWAVPAHVAPGTSTSNATSTSAIGAGSIIDFYYDIVTQRVPRQMDSCTSSDIHGSSRRFERSPAGLGEGVVPRSPARPHRKARTYRRSLQCQAHRGRGRAN